MIGELFNNPLSFVFWLVGLTVAITVHEFAHALAADRLGDPTPRLMGRLTLNPLAHMDPLGTLMLLIARFGWGKPVQFDPYNLRNPRRDGAIISVAGPVANMVLASLGALILNVLLHSKFTFLSSQSLGLPLILLIGLLEPLIVINVVLAVFNLVPIHPLDGFKIVGGLLPDQYARQWAELESYGMIFLILMIIPLFGRSSPISKVVSPIIKTILDILLPGTPLV